MRFELSNWLLNYDHLPTLNLLWYLDALDVIVCLENGVSTYSVNTSLDLTLEQTATRPGLWICDNLCKKSSPHLRRLKASLDRFFCRC